MPLPFFLRRIGCTPASSARTLHQARLRAGRMLRACMDSGRGGSRSEAVDFRSHSKASRSLSMPRISWCLTAAASHGPSGGSLSSTTRSTRFPTTGTTTSLAEWTASPTSLRGLVSRVATSARRAAGLRAGLSGRTPTSRRALSARGRLTGTRSTTINPSTACRRATPDRGTPPTGRSEPTSLRRRAIQGLREAVPATAQGSGHAAPLSCVSRPSASGSIRLDATDSAADAKSAYEARNGLELPMQRREPGAGSLVLLDTAHSTTIPAVSALRLKARASCLIASRVGAVRIGRQAGASRKPPAVQRARHAYGFLPWVGSRFSLRYALRVAVRPSRSTIASRTKRSPPSRAICRRRLPRTRCQAAKRP